MTIKNIHTTHGTHQVTNRLRAERRALRTGQELPDYARYDHLRLFCGEWVDKNTVSGVTLAENVGGITRVREA